MKTLFTYLFIFSLLLCSYTVQNPVVLSTYVKCNGLSNSTIYLNKNGTFLTRLSGGCDGRIETQGKWKINKDTLNCTNVEVRISDDPWKKTGMNCNYLIKKQTIISFSIVDNKVVLDLNECYKKVNSKI